MGVRPPQDDVSEEPDTIAFGIAALGSRLDEADVEFPTETQTLQSALGDVEIPYDAAGNTMTFSAALDSVSQQHFENEQELLNALHPVFEERRAAGGTSILARIRSLVPF